MTRFLAGAMLAVAALTLQACGSGARDIEYSQNRAISGDIGATFNKGPSSTSPGIQQRDEPLGAIPWQMNESHPIGR
jgi:hypothetical protein